MVPRSGVAAVISSYKCESSVGTGEWVKAGSFEVRARKSLHCHGQTVKGNESSERKEESCGGSLSLLRGHLSNPEPNAGRKMMVEAILKRSQMEMRIIFLETGGKVILLQSGQGLGSCVRVLTLCGR